MSVAEPGLRAGVTTRSRKRKIEHAELEAPSRKRRKVTRAKPARARAGKKQVLAGKHGTTQKHTPRFAKSRWDEKVGPPNLYRATHEIFPNLFLGGEHSSRRVELLKKLGVKGIVNLSSRLGNAAPDQFEYLPVRIGDEPDVRIADRFEEVLTFIKKHHDQGHGVLVHCRMGVSRSATCVLAYCVRAKRMPLLEAFQFVKRRRMCVRPNSGFREQLVEFERQELGAVSVDQDDVMDWPHPEPCECVDCMVARFRAKYALDDLEEAADGKQDDSKLESSEAKLDGADADKESLAQGTEAAAHAGDESQETDEKAADGGSADGPAVYLGGEAPQSLLAAKRSCVIL